jgi:hypothetical protein
VAAEIVPASIALWKPFANKGTTLLKRDIVCVHTMVGSLGGSYSWANQAGNSYWHFGMAGSGELWQCHDLRYRSAANLEGNPYVIPIETADHGHPFAAWSGNCGDVPAWTGAQVDKLVELISWLCVRYGIPPTIVPDTQAGRRGLAYHRQGVPNSPEWKTGNLKWSSSVGKCCPDWRRIDQFKTKVVPRVRALAQGEDMTPEQAKQLADAEGRTAAILIFLRDGKLEQLIDARVDAKVTEVLERELQESGSVLRTQGRVLAKLGAEDALKAVPPPA